MNLCFAQTTANKPLSADLLFTKATQSDFSISPDGKYFMQLLKSDVSNEVIIVDIDNYEILYRIPLRAKPVYDLLWLTNKRISYSSNGKIYAIDIEGTNNVILVNHIFDKTHYINRYNNRKKYRLSKIFTELKVNEDEILVQSLDYKGYSKIKRVNIYTGEEFSVIDGVYDKINSWIVDKEGRPAVGIKMNELGWKYFVKDSETQKLAPLQINISDKLYNLQYEAGTFLNQNLTFEGSSFDKDVIYLTSNINDDKRKLISYNYKEKRVLDTIAVDKNCDVGNPEGTEIRILYDYKNKELGGVRYEGVTPVFIPFSNDFKTAYAKVRRKFRTYFNDILDVDSDNNRFVIHQWSDNYAGNIGIYNVVEDNYKIMINFNAELDEYVLSKTKSIGIKNRNGKHLPSYLNLPPNYNKDDENNSSPLIVIPHGGPWSRDYWELDPYAQYFAYQGYAVLRVNFQGSVGFGKEHVLAGVEAINTVMIDDIIDAKNYIQEHYNIDTKRRYVFGHSYGGYAAYLSLIRYPEAFAGGVAIAAPTDLKSWLKTQKEEDNKFTYEYWRTVLGNRGKSYYEEISPINYVDKITKPIMVFHGRNDRIVPFEQAEIMRKEFEKRGRKDKFTTMEFLGHSMRNSSSIGYILEQSDKFFKKL
ncbi:hypothetical protein AAY42_16755 [Flagellimonas eckloniae]|uniref:Peptidase S9 prolyl oligopeptidase catalytic domain-containing protein n=2 Tax=Flagellimonas eckloniae TaxID=346185 RepID=A0A0Q0XQC9_9FLAO|nr:hypothetical protein AAY42_16755 [Allomuricauda eckloniae]